MVSVEPLPKQGCEKVVGDLKKSIDDVSVEPLPKQGCERAHLFAARCIGMSQWNPCRSRGASQPNEIENYAAACLSGTPAEAGVRVAKDDAKRVAKRLSGTPAEAGVRGF